MRIDTKTWLSYGGGLLLALVLAFAWWNTGRTTTAEQEDEESTRATASGRMPASKGGTGLSLTPEQLRQQGVGLASAGPRRITESLPLAGELKVIPERDLVGLARVSGVVVSVNQPLGARVQKGEVIAVIESRELASLRAAEAAATAKVQLATTTLQREERLWHEKVSPEQDYLEAKQAASEARIALEQAKAELQALGALGAGDGNQLALRAPFTGVLTEQKAALGQSVSADTVLFRLSDTDHLLAVTAVPAAQLLLLTPGMTVSIQDTQSPLQSPGRLTRLGAALSEDTHMAPAFFSVDNAKGQWRPGQLVNVRVPARQRDVRVAVVQAALQDLAGQPVVFVRTPTGVTARPVTPGLQGDGFVEITNGLQPGEVYAAENSFLLKAELGKSATQN